MSKNEPNGLAQVIGTLETRFGNRLVRGSALDRYGVSEGPHAGHLPEAVVQPVNLTEVQTIAALATAHQIPITPFGAGTSLEGNAAASRGGLCLDFMLMDKILEIAEEDLLCVVEPGVTRERLNVELRNTGLFFPIDPGANASLGGMIATRASGTNAVRYGTMRENTLALTVVLPNGSVLKTGTRARKSSAGYDLTHLFVGSEGTLGLIVDATLRLYGIPETVLAGVWPFATMQGAVATVIAAIQSGIPIARIELLDPTALHACNLHSNLKAVESPTLFVELHGSPAAVAEQRELLEVIGLAEGAANLVMSGDADVQRKLWRARHQALPAARALRSGAVTWITDVCVPISQLAAAIASAQAAVKEAELLAPILGHVGDGNFHIFFVLDPDQPDEWRRAARANETVIKHALSVGGTCTGEHGVGLGKREALVDEHGALAVDVMRRLKATIDPSGILNPDKIFTAS